MRLRRKTERNEIKYNWKGIKDREKKMMKQKIINNVTQREERRRGKQGKYYETQTIK